MGRSHSGKRRAGRKPKLTDPDRQRLERRLLEGPERLGYETPLRTCPRVAHLMEQEFGITLVTFEKCW